MSASAIRSVLAWEALDSRGRPTVACRMELAGGAAGRVVVPSGASTGGYEARELRDGGERYVGYGVRAAVASVNDVIGLAVLGHDAADRPTLDAALEALDGSDDLGRLGANAALAVSLAATVAAAEAERTPLWRHLGGNRPPLLPMPMVNVISGGAHARGAIDLQDVLAIPVGAASFAEAMEWIARVRAATAALLDEGGGSSALVADEGGLGVSLERNEIALELITRGIERAGLEPAAQVAIAVDVAANQLYDGTRYLLRVDGRALDAQEWSAVLADWRERFPIASLEDVLHEDDWDGWAAATTQLAPGCQLLGDDLFATHLARLEQGIERGVANAVLVKVNQAGTVTRAERTVRRAHEAGYATVVSARSGDTEDGWLADLAVGWRAGQIKVGSTMRSERTAKWNRLLEIEASAPVSEFARFPTAL